MVKHKDEFWKMKLIFHHRLNNNFKVKADYNGQPFTVELEKFIKDAEERVVPDESGDEYLKIVEAGQGGRHDHYLKSGEIQSIHNVLFALNKPTKGAINITSKMVNYLLNPLLKVSICKC